MPLLENRLQDKRILLTGGGSGIGRAVAQKLHVASARVAITGRTPSKLNETNKLLGGRLLTLTCDGTDPKAVAATVEIVQKELGHIDILINNAGINIKGRSSRQLTVTDWRQVIQCNLDSAFFFIHAVLPAMRERKAGHIINISSISGLRATALSGPAYTASKFGMTALSLCVGLEEAENGIRTTAICPGEVDTPILDQRPMPISAQRRAIILKPDDVAEAVYFAANLRPGVSVPELIITPALQPFA
jgi:NADP-dependent 3-hydroxy acid dehydrogenase YdfG